MNQDGSMPIEEYLRRAKAAQRAAGTGRQYKQQNALPPATKTKLATQMQALMAFMLSQRDLCVHLSVAGDTMLVQPSSGYGEVVVTCAEAAKLPNAVHPDASLATRRASVPMAAMIRGEVAYPTLEEHLARTSPAHEPVLNAFGVFESRPLTKDQENAIRCR
jgi:hypothetical protein